MTNKEWMSTLTAEQFYDEMMWLVRVFGFRFNNTRLGIIDWLDEPHEAEPTQNKTSNALNALEQENKEGKEELTGRNVGKWIPVTERLPLYGQDVLAVRTYGDGEKCQEVLMAHIAVWNEETGKKWWNATNITHWQPLPEPPKEE